MISTIAVGTDGSETATRAVDAALDLAERYDARIVFLSAYDTSMAIAAAASGAPVDLQWLTNQEGEAGSALEQAETRARERGIACASASAAGDPAEVLVRLAEEHGVDILVIGNRGMRRRLLGSVPNTVTHRASCSVLVVKTT